MRRNRGGGWPAFPSPQEGTAQTQGPHSRPRERPSQAAEGFCLYSSALQTRVGVSLTETGREHMVTKGEGGGQEGCD